MIRLGLVLKREFHFGGHWVSALTPPLVDGILRRFECRWIESQQDYEREIGDLEAILSMEPGWAAPKLEFGRTPQLRAAMARIPSYIWMNDPHAHQWRESYAISNNFKFILTCYPESMARHFTRLANVLPFPWGIPDNWMTDNPLEIRGQRITCSGASQNEAYELRNWCRTFGSVESFANSGVEGRMMPDSDYPSWLASCDACIAATSDNPAYRLMVPKYYEIPAMGSLLFAQETDGLEAAGFKHMVNCVVFSRSDFAEKAKTYLTNPWNYLDIRRAGRQLVRSRHLQSHRLSMLENHIGNHR
jgi:hypothetical protein